MPLTWATVRGLAPALFGVPTAVATASMARSTASARPPGSRGVVAPYTTGATLFGPGLLRHTLASRYERGARFQVQPASAPRPSGHEPLFVVRADGRLEPVTGAPPVPAEGDTVVLLGPAPAADTEPAG
ncbi:hypothetical protein [Streptomyces sp. NPDC054834]